MVTAVWNGVVIAESADTVIVEGNHYFPPESVNKEYFRDSDHRSTCFWKGRARYYTLEVDGKVNPNAAWYYPDPSDAAQHITDHIAFWRGVKVEN